MKPKKRFFYITYRYLRQAHSRLHSKRIKAGTAEEAFRRAVDIIKESHKHLDDFVEFYVVPQRTLTDDWRTECHGWDNEGSFPRSWGGK